MLEHRSILQPFRSGFAFDKGRIAQFRSGAATLGCAVTALALWDRLEAAANSAQFDFMMSTLQSRIRKGRSRKICASHVSTGSYSESTLAEKRARGAAALTSL